MGHLLKSKLLEFKEDVQDIALSSLKEADIENKKSAIATDWEDREFKFAEFKHRGTIILKGDETAQIKEVSLARLCEISVGLAAVSGIVASA